MARMRFTAAEKALLTAGATVEVRTGRYWHPATVTTGTIECTHGTFQSVVTVVTSGKYAGQVWHARPTAIRPFITAEAAQAEAVTAYRAVVADTSDRGAQVAYGQALDFYAGRASIGVAYAETLIKDAVAAQDIAGLHADLAHAGDPAACTC